MDKRLKQVILGLMAVAAIACIGFGIYRVWGSFTEFDEAMLREKDSQYYSLIESNDVNIENSLGSFSREAENFFGRPRFVQLRKDWVESGGKDSQALESYLRENAPEDNPVYSDLVMIYKDKVRASASGSIKYKFVTDADEQGIRLCSDDNGKYFMSYEITEGRNVRFDALLDPVELFNSTVGMTSSADMMLMGNNTSLCLFREDGNVTAAVSLEGRDENIVKCLDSITECESNGKANGISLELTNNDGGIYNARMIVMPSKELVNREFAIGVLADYEEAVAPSRHAAEQILINSGVAVTGVFLLLIIMFLLRRENTANARELELLKKKNSEMEELNQNMLALSHHQRLETIGTMTASIAHDFNNLLTPIMGYSMMSMEMLPPGMEDIQENLMEVYNASVKAKDMVTRLAELTKKGKEENFTSLDPSEIISNSLKVTLPAKPKNVDVKVRYRSNNRTMRGDATQISQLVMNIVLNAYDAMREKGGTIYISTGIEDNRIAMRFKDTGDGMDAETVARIFDPFYTTKESGKGTGLGLAIVAQIAETHGGKVYVDSAPGEGTEFRITFPMLEKETKFDKAKTIQINLEDLKDAMND